MKSYLLYELKRLRFTIFLTTTLLFAVCFIVLHTADYSGRVVFFSIFMLMGLACIVPTKIYAFKTRAKQVDLLYSMPISRSTIYIVKTILGLLCTLIPFTVCYWFMGIFSIFEGTPNVALLLVGYYFSAIALGVCLYGFCAFAFCLAFRRRDGNTLVILYSVVFYSIASFVATKLYSISGGKVEFTHYICSFPQGGLFALAIKAMSAFYNFADQGYGELPSYYNGLIIFSIIIGVLGWIAFGFCVKYEKPEKAEQASDAIFGYTTLIPTLMICSIGSASLSGVWPIAIIMPAVMGVVGFVYFRRSAHIHRRDKISLAIAIVAGILLSFL